MNKKTYKTPSIRITEVDLSHSLLAGSPEPSSKVGVQSDGDGITVSKEEEEGDVDVYDSKHYNTWEAWDEY
ncbi:MAG: hypothetical protein PUF41_08815 [Prevotella copri]|nr:hypothetical protein [Segatella copri]